MLLKKGSRGTNVKYLQYGLRIMCINPGGLDGVFGEGTYNAVRKFQERFGLSADGIVGDGTWNKLKDQIRPIQSALNNHNYKLTVDGVAGDATYNAVRKIQRDHGLTDDGMVDNDTWKLLRATSGSSHSINKSSLLAKFNKRRFFNSIYVNLNGFDIAKPLPSPHPNIAMSAKVSLVSTIGNKYLTIDSLYSGCKGGTISYNHANININNILLPGQKTTLLKALDSIGIDLFQVGNATVKLNAFSNGNKFTVVIQNSLYLDGATLYETLVMDFFRLDHPSHPLITEAESEFARASITIALICLAITTCPAVAFPAICMSFA